VIDRDEEQRVIGGRARCDRTDQVSEIRYRRSIGYRTKALRSEIVANQARVDFAPWNTELTCGLESKLQPIRLDLEIVCRESGVSDLFPFTLVVSAMDWQSDLSAPENGTLRHPRGSGKKRIDPDAFSGNSVG
jgi:hypothetical protein